MAFLDLEISETSGGRYHAVYFWGIDTSCMWGADSLKLEGFTNKMTNIALICLSCLLFLQNILEPGIKSPTNLCSFWKIKNFRQLLTEYLWCCLPSNLQNIIRNSIHIIIKTIVYLSEYIIIFKIIPIILIIVLTIISLF